ncbi:HlyD family secretion protein [Flavisolibacter ginsenosidimutans]|uniref:HlyD family secretion protein n=1 Tax=Flavisolibacter ginsenosidimutans TaxID=661481 RepID=A0A5B8UL66_9BACT|nr:HlyD family secretion protein [Flavisolibacter ginsenosidimutans]QEC57122.1 HlyD family secretion protein [Flavisolibacter ginsenosidimutans]
MEAKVIETEKTTENTNEPKKKSKGFLIVLILLVAFGAWFGISKYTHAQHHEETDDAHVEANISPVIPRVSGYVADVRVNDNQRVKKGDTLVVLDNRDLKIKLEQAEAALQTAQSNLSAAKSSTNAASANIASSRASIGTINAQIETAKVNVWRTSQDYDRYANLIKDHSITQQQYEQALAAKQTAERQLQVLEEQRAQAAQQTIAVASQSNATSSQIGIAGSVIKQRQVDVEDAKLNLSYAVITAPADGLISKVSVQPGQFVQAGQSLFSIVLNEDVWVIGNFKETQFDKMKIGQNVTVHIDAFPSHDFDAKLTSFSPATGSSFALLPPDNASGNFVKVVQRLPVKIEFKNPNDPAVKQLRAGMNAVVDVHLD